jgi:hypothetical protein
MKGSTPTTVETDLAAIEAELRSIAARVSRSEPARRYGPTWISLIPLASALFLLLYA